MKRLAFFLILLHIPFVLQGQDFYEIRFTAGVTQYRCALVIYDDGISGIMRVRYYDNGTKMVEQTVRIEDTVYGTRIAGYNPVYPGTNTKHPTYSADNFYISYDEYGNTSIVNIDDYGVTAVAVIRQIEGRYYINEFLSDFDWRLD